MAGLSFRDCQCSSAVSLLLGHALLTENKVSADGSGRDFMVWGEAVITQLTTGASCSPAKWGITSLYTGVKRETV